MKSIEFSLHSIQKIALLKEHGFVISKEYVIGAVNNPDIVSPGKSGRMIAEIKLDENHILRVIYEESDDKIFIVTIYPARRIRYEKN